MLENGKNVGGYTLLKYLDSGGFGDVWQAEKRTAFSVTGYALKFFRPKEETILDFEKIRKEVEFSQKLSGLPYIISVIEADKFDNYIYIVSELADGGSLGKYLSKSGGKAKTQAEAISITRQILNGLEQMHRQEIVHRDLKPANILIKKGIFCLADFGISREMKSHSKATGTAGTYEYMPPEAFDKSPSVSAYTDIWAVGVMLQKLLTGNLPFPQNEVPSLMAAILMHEPEEMPAEIPFGLREIVKKALQKNRENRFQTAEEMRSALEKALTKQEESVPIRPFVQTIDEDEYERENQAEKERQEKFELGKRAELLQRLKNANEKAKKFGWMLGDADLTETKVAQFENKIAEAGRKAQETEAERQLELEHQRHLELLKRVNIANGKAVVLGVGILPEGNLNERRVSQFESYIYEKEEEEAKRNDIQIKEALLREVEQMRLQKIAEEEKQRKGNYLKKGEKQDLGFGWAFTLTLVAGFVLIVLIAVILQTVNSPVNINSPNTNSNRVVPNINANIKIDYDIPPINGQVTSFKLFEAGKGDMPQSERKYGTVFIDSATRYINTELTLDFPTQETEKPFSYDIIWINRKTNKIIHSYKNNTSAPKDWSGSIETRGYGSESSGSWKPGLYSVRIKYNGKVIASSDFEVRAGSDSNNMNSSVNTKPGNYTTVPNCGSEFMPCETSANIVTVPNPNNNQANRAPNAGH